MTKNKVDLPRVGPDYDRAQFISRAEAVTRFSVSELVAKKLAADLTAVAAVKTGKVGRPTVLFAVADFSAAVESFKQEREVLAAAKGAAAALADGAVPDSLPPAREVLTAETAVEVQRNSEDVAAQG